MDPTTAMMTTVSETYLVQDSRFLLLRCGAVGFEFGDEPFEIFQSFSRLSII